jgi:hypothetical protein
MVFYSVLSMKIDNARGISSLLLLAVGGLLLYGIITVVYRLCFHPLRKIPGPWIAATTGWYEFYEDIVLAGHYIKELPKLHARYGQ